jgi:glycine/D-amino acid oxidase-like deaminating enzyme
VTIVESRLVGGGATAAGMGHIVVMDDSDAQIALTRYSQQIWDERTSSDFPADTERDPCGTLWVAADDEEMQEVERKRDVYGSIGIDSEVLDGTTVYDHEPNLRSGLAGGLRVPGDSVVYPPCTARYLVDEVVRRGGRLVIGKVTSIGAKEVTLADGSTLTADHIINATGHWAPRLTPEVPVRLRKGHLVITARYPGFVKHQLIELGYLKSAHNIENDSVAFNVQPRPTGQLLIGSSRQVDTDDAAVEPHMLAKMLQRAAEYMPTLKDIQAVRTWTGFRAATPDSLPLIGPHPGVDGLYLATGHEGLGITTSMGTAKLLTDQILGRDSAIPVEPYLPARLLQEAADA